MTDDPRSLEKQLAHEISTLERRLNEVSKSADQQSRYVTDYLHRALARRSSRLEAIVSLRQPNGVTSF
jgi:hypothetical protein